MYLTKILIEFDNEWPWPDMVFNCSAFYFLNGWQFRPCQCHNIIWISANNVCKFRAITTQPFRMRHFWLLITTTDKTNNKLSVLPVEKIIQHHWNFGLQVHCIWILPYDKMYIFCIILIQNFTVMTIIAKRLDLQYCFINGSKEYFLYSVHSSSYKYINDKV